MVRLFFTKPVLFQAWWLGLMSCTIMVSWWTTLTFLLSDTPFQFNTFEIGLFGLTGICAVAWAPYAGRLTDKMLPWCTSLSALIGHLIFQSIALGAARLNLAPVIICCICTFSFAPCLLFPILPTILTSLLLHSHRHLPPDHDHREPSSFLRNRRHSEG